MTEKDAEGRGQPAKAADDGEAIEEQVEEAVDKVREKIQDVLPK